MAQSSRAIVVHTGSDLHMDALLGPDGSAFHMDADEVGPLQLGKARFNNACEDDSMSVGSTAVCSQMPTLESLRSQAPTLESMPDFACPTFENVPSMVDRPIDLECMDSKQNGDVVTWGTDDIEACIFFDGEVSMDTEHEVSIYSGREQFAHFCSLDSVLLADDMWNEDAVLKSDIYDPPVIENSVKLMKDKWETDARTAVKMPKRLPMAKLGVQAKGNCPRPSDAKLCHTEDDRECHPRVPSKTLLSESVTDSPSSTSRRDEPMEQDTMAGAPAKALRRIRAAKAREFNSAW